MRRVLRRPGREHRLRGGAACVERLRKRRVVPVVDGVGGIPRSAWEGRQMWAGLSAGNGEVPVDEDQSTRNLPGSFSPGESVDVAGTGHFDATVMEAVYGDDVRLDEGDVIVELNQNVGDAVLAGLVLLAHAADGPGHEGSSVTGEGAVVVDRARVIDRCQELLVGAVDGPAVEVQHIGNRLAVQERTHFCLCPTLSRWFLLLHLDSSYRSVQNRNKAEWPAISWGA